MSKTILFTISNAAGTVYKFRSFQQRGYRVIGCDANPHAAGRQFADTFYLVPLQKDPDYLDRLLEIVKKEKVDILVGGEGESLMLNKNRGRFTAENCTLVATDSPTLQIALDKCGLFRPSLGKNRYPPGRLCRCQ